MCLPCQREWALIFYSLRQSRIHWPCCKSRPGAKRELLMSYAPCQTTANIPAVTMMVACTSATFSQWFSILVRLLVWKSLQLKLGVSPGKGSWGRRRFRKLYKVYLLFTTQIFPTCHEIYRETCFLLWKSRRFCTFTLSCHCLVGSSAAPLASASPEVIPLSLAGPSQIQKFVKAHQEFWLQIIPTVKHNPSSMPQSAFIGRSTWGWWCGGANLALQQHLPAALRAHAVNKPVQLFSKLGAE